MRHLARATVGLLVATAATVGISGPAAAATVGIERTLVWGPERAPGPYVTYTVTVDAGPGESNDIELSVLDPGKSAPGEVAVRDHAVRLQAGNGCAEERGAVRCPVAGDAWFLNITTDLGDGEDRLVGGPARRGRLEVKGGDGDDQIRVAGDARNEEGFIDVDGGPGADSVRVVAGEARGGPGNDLIDIVEGRGHGDDGDDVVNVTTVEGYPWQSWGGGGDDRLSVTPGSRGATLYDGPGCDTVTGGGDYDVIVSGAATGDCVAGERFDGGPGGNRISYAERGGPVDVDLRGGRVGAAGDPDLVVNVEGVVGTPFADRMIAGDEGDYFDGGGGGDVLVGGQGDDVFYDQCRHGEPASSMVGGAGNDVLVGGCVVDGGPGNDHLRGRHLNGGPGDDDLTFGWLLGGTVRGGTGNDELHGDSARLVDGGPGDDEVQAFASVAVLTGGTGDDVIWAASVGRVVCGPGKDLLGPTVSPRSRVDDCESLSLAPQWNSRYKVGAGWVSHPPRDYNIDPHPRWKRVGRATAGYITLPARFSGYVRLLDPASRRVLAAGRATGRREAPVRTRATVLLRQTAYGARQATDGSPRLVLLDVVDPRLWSGMRLKVRRRMPLA
jgi:hypothetical protein